VFLPPAAYAWPEKAGRLFIDISPLLVFPDKNLSENPFLLPSFFFCLPVGQILFAWSLSVKGFRTLFPADLSFCFANTYSIIHFKPFACLSRVVAFRNFSFPCLALRLLAQVLAMCLSVRRNPVSVRKHKFIGR